jgi:hypothetical protein
MFAHEETPHVRLDDRDFPHTLSLVGVQCVHLPVAEKHLNKTNNVVTS